MNKCQLLGRLTANPDIRYTQGQDAKCVARFTLAVDRKFKRDGDQNADFINCVCFGRIAEIIEKYVTKGMKICIAGRIQTGSYIDREGKKVYTTDVVVEDLDFCESKSSNDKPSKAPQEPSAAAQPSSDGFMEVPEGMQVELPFV